MANKDEIKMNGGEVPAERFSGYVHVLKKPFSYEDETFKEFTFNWDMLSGKDMVDIEREMSDDGEFALSPEYSTSYLLRLAAKAADVNYEVIKCLPIDEASVIRNKTRDFLRRGA